MIICSCNHLSENEIRAACAPSRAPPEDVYAIYERLNCAPQCGNCLECVAMLLLAARDDGVACVKEPQCPILSHEGKERDGVL